MEILANGYRQLWRHQLRGVAVLLVLAVVAVLAYLFLYQPLKVSVIRCDRGEGQACANNNIMKFDTTKTDAIRIEDLLGRMTLEEKIGQMALVEKNSLPLSDVSHYGIGAVLSGSGGKPQDNTPAGWRTMVEGFAQAAQKSRLGIPLLYGVDANHGHSNVPGATVFPHQIGLGATGDPALVQRIAKATTEELLATNINWNFMPALDEPRDIRWGRTYEGFGQDPNLVSSLGEAYVRGGQLVSADTGRLSILGTAKHYVGAGSMQWGTSINPDYKIDQAQTPSDEQALRQQYLPPFQAAIQANVGSVMVGLNKWGNTFTVANHYLLTNVLKEELGFKGFVVSDWYGVYEMSGSDYQNTIMAINAGVDMVMLPFDYKQFIRNVTTAVQKGEISKERIDDAVRRILAAKFSLGLFDSRPVLQLDIIGSVEHRVLAREAVQQSLVLLKNDNALPLEATVNRIAVAGSAADNIGRQSGGWTVEWQGIDGNWLPGATSILKGLRDNAPAGVTVDYSADAKFDSPLPADVGIAVVGEKPYAEGWGDNAEPSITKEDQAAIASLRAQSKKLIVIVVSGRPLLLGEALDSSDVLIAAWLPGSEGAGVTDALFGKALISGTLPLAWPARAKDLSKIAPPLYPIGFGLKLK
jgi:beta-glucosidase